VLFDGWTSFSATRWCRGASAWRRARARLEEKCCRASVEKQRCVTRQKGEVGEAHRDPRTTSYGLSAASHVLLKFYFITIHVFSSGSPSRWEDDEDHLARRFGDGDPRVRQAGNVGIMADALADEVAAAPHRQVAGRTPRLKTERGELRFTPSAAFPQIAGGEVTTLQPRRAALARTPTPRFVLGDRLFPSRLPPLRSGHAHPEARGRGATSPTWAKFQPRRAARRGMLEYVVNNEATTLCACSRPTVPNQGDAWSYTSAYLEAFRGIEALEEGHGGFLALIADARGAHRERNRASPPRRATRPSIPKPSAAKTFEAWRHRVRRKHCRPSSRWKKLNERKRKFFPS